MRVLDLGCGRAATSIFLAREFGVQVVAADLWVQPTENWPRLRDAGVESRVLPLHAEAHDLKFAHDYFDAIVSVDAYHYFGTDDLYLDYLVDFLRPGGQLGIVVPAHTKELDGDVSEHLSDEWDSDWASFHGPDWWRRHWARSAKVTVDHADLLPDGWKHWLRWERMGAINAPDAWREHCAAWAERLEKDSGRSLGFARVIARRPAC